MTGSFNHTLPLPPLDRNGLSLHLGPMLQYNQHQHAAALWILNLLLATVSVTSTEAQSISPSSANDWPQFRGPSGQGTATSGALPHEWNCQPEGPCSANVAWKQAIPGQGWSSPIVGDGKVYLTTAITENGGLSLRVLCLDAQKGKMLWNEEAFSKEKYSPQMHGKNSEASPTPLLEGKRLYAHFGHHGTACLDLTGKILWRNNSLPYPPVHGNGGSPVIVNDALIFSADGASDPFIAALNKHDGKVLWKVDRKSDATKKFSFSTPLVITVQGKSQVISPGSNVVTAHDPENGREIWRVRYDGYSVIPRPVYAHGLVYLSSGFEEPQVLAIRPDGTGDVTSTHVKWSVKRNAPKTPSMLVVGSELYMVADDGIASCLDAASGKVYWAERVGRSCSASPIYADGKIYIQTEDGDGVVLKAGKQFSKLATNPIGEKTLASYAAGQNALFIRSEKHLYKVVNL